MKSFLRLSRHSLRESWFTLACCAAVIAAFQVLRIWVASQLDFEALSTLLRRSRFSFVERLLPIPLDVIASPLGRSAFGFEEFPTLLMMCLWAVARGSDCYAGRQQSGVLEMTLAQPVRRSDLSLSHGAVTLAGVVAIALAAWTGVALGIHWAPFPNPPPARQLAPAVANLAGLGVFAFGLASAASAWRPTRSGAVGVSVGILIVQAILLGTSRVAPSARWLERFTLLSFYNPSKVAVGMQSAPVETAQLLWHSHLALIGVGFALAIAAAVRFSYRDLPPPS
ncbi:MAG: ABC transporter permease subunit [Planctomycetales bacterium]|nr:ABC transporter permease subunit [Planctomycetales bacterium]